MIEPEKQTLSVSRQCRLLSISRSSFYYKQKPGRPEDLELMRLIDEQYLKAPCWGSRSMRNYLRRLGYKVNRKRIQRLMRTMGLEAIYPKPRTSRPHPEHRLYPYLLRNLIIDRPNQVWTADITYIPMSRGFMYLVAVMDWYSRKILSWRVSNTLDSEFCVEAKPLNAMVLHRSSIPIRGHSLPAAVFSMCWTHIKSGSVWTAGAGSRIIFS
jgi:putative transposase